MRHDNIDISKSKQKGRVVRKTWIIDLTRDIIVYLCIVGGILITASLFFIDQLEKKEHLLGASVYFGLAIIYGALMFFSILSLDRLKRINGVKKNQNRQAIIDLTEKLGWNLHIHNQQVSVLSPPWTRFLTNWGRLVVVIYDRQDILINSTSFGRHDVKSPFHWFGNRKTEGIVKDNFEEKIKNGSQ